MQLTFLGAAHEVTGSCTMLEACGKRILIDCGLEQGRDIYENCDLPVIPGDIDAIIVTHAHIDHSGNVPTMVAGGFNASVYSTEATYKLCDIMLRDSAHIQEFEAEWRNRKAKRSGEKQYVPLYTMSDAENALKMFVPCSYGKTINICDGISITFLDAGHLLGSSSVTIEINEEGISKTLLFSGDIGNYARPLIRDPQKPKKADFVVIESTYGDRVHGQRPDYVTQLTSVLQDTFDRGGNVVIPSFAVGRTQELLYLIRIIKERGLIIGHSDFPVYVDSPLAVEATNLYSSNLTEYYDDETLELLDNGIDPIHFNSLRLSVTSDDSRFINEDTAPKVILSASGMCEAGRIRHHLKHNLWREESTILFVGYQSEGTIGRKLIDGAQTVKLFGEEIAVKAKIVSLAGISGHSDKDMLISWLAALENKPTRVFVNHGQDSVCDSFAAEISKRLGFSATAPFSGDKFDLCLDECIEKGNIKRIERQFEARERANMLYDRLLAAGKRLLAIIAQNKESSNKEISRFTDQINALCDKYSRK